MSLLFIIARDKRVSCLSHYSLNSSFIRNSGMRPISRLVSLVLRYTYRYVKRITLHIDKHEKNKNC